MIGCSHLAKGVSSPHFFPTTLSCNRVERTESARGASLGTSSEQANKRSTGREPVNTSRAGSDRQCVIAQGHSCALLDHTGALDPGPVPGAKGGFYVGLEGLQNHLRFQVSIVYITHYSEYFVMNVGSLSRSLLHWASKLRVLY